MIPYIGMKKSQLSFDTTSNVSNWFVTAPASKDWAYRDTDWHCGLLVQPLLDMFCCCRIHGRHAERARGPGSELNAAAVQQLWDHHGWTYGKQVTVR